MVLASGWRGTVTFIAFGALGTLFLAGCGTGPRRVPAGGTVTLDEKPMEGGILYFDPDAAKGNSARVSCMSPIRKDGRFDLRTDGVERSDSGPGIPLGWYKVYVRVNDPGEVPIFPGQPAYKINPKFRNPDKTPLAIEVVDNPAPGAYDLKITSK
jgi:hypothetical protein